MNSVFNEKNIAYLALISGLSISVVAEYYSIVGLTTIFPARALDIVIMGIVLGVGKIAATLWLKETWRKYFSTMHAILIGLVAILMMVTSMGIFGLLSRAHSDQAVPTQSIAAKVALLDEKIKVEQENIETNRRALQQMDSTVDQTLSRSTNESGAERAAQLRRSQLKERTRLLSEIDTSQKKIAQLRDERMPVAAELRKFEAEVGPIKYLAAFFYGATDQAILEKAVTWLIIILIIVFEPLAITLLLASQTTFQKLREVNVHAEQPPPNPEQVQPTPPTDDSTLFVQNEEQTESNLWSSTTGTISPEDYQAISKQRMDQTISRIKDKL